MGKKFVLGAVLNISWSCSSMNSVALVWSWRKLFPDLDGFQASNEEISKSEILDIVYAMSILNTLTKKHWRLAKEWYVWCGFSAHDVHCWSTVQRITLQESEPARDLWLDSQEEVRLSSSDFKGHWSHGTHWSTFLIVQFLHVIKYNYAAELIMPLNKNSNNLFMLSFTKH